MAMPTILVIEDEIEIVRLLRDYLEEAGFGVRTASDADRGLHLLRAESPDLVVLDLGLPDSDGRDLTRLIRSDPRLAAVPIIFLTARVAESDRIVGLELGADDYIPKPFNPREVVARVRAVLRRSSGGKPDAARRLSAGGLTLDPDGHTLTVRGRPVELTPTEFELLALFMENPGHTYTREELLEKTLGYSYEGTGRTLDTHILNLRRKIEADPRRPDWIQTVHRIGYRFAKPSGRKP
jgi:two-component system alkaline phosphatase synthesis response regulator PhoP